MCECTAACKQGQSIDSRDDIMLLIGQNGVNDLDVKCCKADVMLQEGKELF